jgi:hypothetical protein
MTTPKMKTVGSKVHQVRQILSVKSLPESADFVLTGGDGLADVCGDKQGDSRTKT